MPISINPKALAVNGVVELGGSGGSMRWWNFAVEVEPVSKPFIFRHGQGTNHWESSYVCADLEDIAIDPAQYQDLLARSNCTWAIPILDRGTKTGDLASVIEQLIEQSVLQKTMQSER